MPVFALEMFKKKKSQTIFAFQKVLLQSEGNFSCGSTADYVQL